MNIDERLTQLLADLRKQRDEQSDQCEHLCCLQLLRNQGPTPKWVCLECGQHLDYRADLQGLREYNCRIFALKSPAQ